MILIYHHNDNDGYLAAAVACLYLQKEYSKEIKFFVGNFNESPPIELLERAEKIYVLDYVLPDIIMKAYFDKIVWIDHHKRYMDSMYPIEQEIGKNFVGLRIEGKCGCLLTWEFFYPKVIPPYVIDLVNARDVWNFTNPNSGFSDPIFEKEVHAFHEVSRSFNKELKVWLNLLTDNRLVHHIVASGAVIFNHIKNTIDSLIRLYSWEDTWEGHKVALMNCPIQLSGYTHRALEDSYPDCDFVLLFTYKENKIEAIMYRNTSKNPDINLGDIARKYGGNGHPGHAGFFTTKILWRKKEKN